MCDCQEQLENKLRENFIKERPEARAVAVSIKGYVLTLSKTAQSKPSLPILITAMLPLKDGITFKRRKINQTMIASYCPFCGVKI